MPPTQRHVPRGRGYSKRAIERHARALRDYEGSIQSYARKEHQSRGTPDVNPLVVALEDKMPEFWASYVAEHGIPAESACPYCRKTFVPNRGGMEYCDAKCARNARTDQAYFGGKRRETIGLLEGECQLCGAKRSKGLQSHHLIGKENDPENAHLIALCSGCHNLVTDASRRLFLREDAGWAKLRRLVEVRVAGVLDGERFVW